MLHDERGVCGTHNRMQHKGLGLQQRKQRLHLLLMATGCTGGTVSQRKPRWVDVAVDRQRGPCVVVPQLDARQLTAVKLLSRLKHT